MINATRTVVVAGAAVLGYYLGDYLGDDTFLGDVATYILAAVLSMSSGFVYDTIATLLASIRYCEVFAMNTVSSFNDICDFGYIFESLVNALFDLGLGAIVAFVFG